MQELRTQRTVVGPELQAILLMLFATACFVGMTSSAKALHATMATPQIVWGRYTTHFLIVLVLLQFRLAQVLQTARPGIQLTRSVFMFAATSLAFLSLRYLPLAEVASIMFLTPMLVTALAALVLREVVGLRRWGAVAVGFLGALVIIRPSPEAFQWAALAAVGCAGCYAMYQITTRVVADGAPPLVSLFYSCLLGTVASSAALPWFWTTPDAQGWGLMALSGAFGAIGHLAMIAALGRAAASFVTPFSYAQLIWATLAGVVFFGELPDVWTYVGAALIAGSGLYVMHRERVVKAKAGGAPP